MMRRDIYDELLGPELVLMRIMPVCLFDIGTVPCFGRWNVGVLFLSVRSKELKLQFPRFRSWTPLFGAFLRWGCCAVLRREQVNGQVVNTS